MSQRNTLANKKARREARSAKTRAPALMVAISVKDVKAHRYLRDHGLPFSNRAANVMIPGDQVTV